METIANRRRGRTRKGSLIAAVVAMPMVGAASLAYACTSIVGTTTVSPTSGPAGTSVTASATGLTPTNLYNLNFADSAFLQSDQCMHATTIGSNTSDANGNVPNTTGTIPAGSATGAGEVCFVDAVHTMATDSSTPTSFTVT